MQNFWKSGTSRAEKLHALSQPALRMLQKVADSYDTRVENTLKGLTATLEPIMIVTLGGIVMVVALAILLPMLNMSSIAR